MAVHRISLCSTLLDTNERFSKISSQWATLYLIWKKHKMFMWRLIEVAYPLYFYECKKLLKNQRFKCFQVKLCIQNIDIRTQSNNDVPWKSVFHIMIWHVNPLLVSIRLRGSYDDVQDIIWTFHVHSAYVVDALQFCYF